MTALLVVGTGPEVGTTSVTAALAALALDRGTRVTVIAPAQTGRGDDEPGSLARVTALAGDGVRVVELARYPDALSPAAAARRSGRAPLDPAVCADAVLSAGRSGGLVLVDAPGGLLVRYDEDGFTMAELARSLRLPVVVVAGPGRGTVNATALTLEAVAHRGLDLQGVVLAGWPAEPSAAEQATAADVEMLAARPLLGVLPPPPSDRQAFVGAARAGLAPALGGTSVAAVHRRAARP